MVEWVHKPEFAEEFKSEGEWEVIDGDSGDKSRREWRQQVTDSWASEDGKLRVLKREFSCGRGEMVHLMIRAPEGEPSWPDKQEIKNRFAGEDRVAVEVFPTTSDLEDFGPFYHLWVLPKDFRLPFNLKDFGGKLS